MSNTTSLKITDTARSSHWVSPLWQAVASLFGGRSQARSRAEEARQVREMARHLQHRDPGVAADLFAAADRHETIGR